jgi:hypothetical protein
MRIAFCILCIAMCSGIAGAQTPRSNFEACVTEARQKHTDSAMENYLSFKCDGATAERLAARPDQCAGDVRPLLRNVERRSRQLDDGLYRRIVWRTDMCAGMCETRFYTDARETNYLCEVRRHLESRVRQNYGRPLRNADYYQPYGEEYPPPSAPRWTYGPAVKSYEQPRYSRPRVTERWYYVEPGWYREYRPSDYADDDRRDDYRRDDYSRDDYRRDDYRRDDYDYRRGDDRAEDRRDGYLRYEYR